MKKHKKTSRRSFIKKLGASTPLLASAPALLTAKKPENFYILKPKSKVAANDRIQIASLGMGIIGFADVKSALATEGVELVSVADCYEGRLVRTKEVFGNQVKATRDYREILDDPSIDAVIVATTDHWHNRMAIEAMQKGKAVYCEKPVVQHIEEGAEVIKVQQETGAPFQVGSQFASSLVHRKAKELYEAGEIGQLVVAEATFDRFDALGAWQYSIPPDASPQTIDWNMFLGDAPKVPFDPVRFFRWRNYRDYGTGIPGDLFVHLFTMLHIITSSTGPNKIYATGGLRYWDDGRDVADVMMGLFDYPDTQNHPAFNLALRVNFVDGSGGKTGIRLVGSEGEMELGWTSITLRKNKMPKAPGYGGWDSFGTFPKKTQEAFVKEYEEKYSGIRPELIPPGEMTYATPEGYDMRNDHFADWFNVIRNGGETVEGAVFGMRAAGPALASNVSHYDNKIVYWDPENMQMTQA